MMCSLDNNTMDDENDDDDDNNVDVNLDATDDDDDADDGADVGLLISYLLIVSSSCVICTIKLITRVRITKRMGWEHVDV